MKTKTIYCHVMATCTSQFVSCSCNFHTLCIQNCKLTENISLTSKVVFQYVLNCRLVRLLIDAVQRKNKHT